MKGTHICDPLSENPALHANIEFEIEAVLSVQFVSQLNSDYCTMCLGLDYIMLHYEARLCYYNDDISSNSQAGPRNTGTRCFGQLVRVFQKTQFYQLLVRIRLFFCPCRHNVSPHFHNCCLSQLSLPTSKLLFYKNTCKFT